MKKTNQNRKIFYKTSKGGAEKVIVLMVMAIFLFTASSSAILQDPKSISTPEDQARSIVWDATISFTNPTSQNDYVVFGEAPDANDGPPADSYDVAKPPAPMPPYIRAYLKDGLPTPYINLWRDYRQYPDTAKTWNLSIMWYPEDEESPTTITISWSTAEVDESEYTTVNFCTNTGAVLKNMLIDTSYTFTCPALTPQNFKIICFVTTNQPPVANPDSFNINEDTTLTIAAPGVLGNDNDPNGDPITAVKQSDPSHGTVTLNSNGGFTYIPALNYFGSDSFTYKAYDGSLYSNLATVTITVNAVNDPPVVTNIPDQTIAEGSSFTTINLDNYVSDVDNIDAQMTWTYSGNSQLTVSIVSRVATITIPNADWYGSETITFKATDPGGLWDDDPATFTVTNINDAPVVTNIPDQTIAEGSMFSTIILDNYVSDVDNTDAQMTWTYSGNSQLTVSIVNRVATITTPNSDWNGAETITFKATDPGGLWDDDPATFTVTAVNDAPIVSDIPDQTVAEGSTFTSISLDNYVSDVDNTDAQMTWTYSGNSQLIVSIVNRVATITIPNADWYGSETITFRATDPGGLWDDDPATFTVTNVNDAPVVSDIPSQTIAEGSAFTTINLDNYVSDIDNPDSQMTWTYSGNVELIVSIVNRVATITTPNADWYGAETITFKATDPGGLWDDDPATFTVTAVNDPPVANSDSYNTNENTPLTVPSPGVLGNDIDVDGDSLTAVKVSDPTHGFVVLNSNGGFTYTPDEDYHGDDTFTYKAYDGTVYSNIATVTITVNPVNQPPVATDDTATVPFDSTNNKIDVLANDDDPDEDPLTITGVTAASHGITSTDGDYVYYTPTTGYSGADSFTYTIDDGNGGTDTGAVSITVQANAPPSKPQRPTGPTSGKANVEYTFNATTTDPNNHQIYYQWDWGDGDHIQLAWTV